MSGEQTQPQLAALVGLRALWHSPVNATTKPGLIMAVTEYWWRKWLPILGWARWFLVTMLRWTYLKRVGLDGDHGGEGAATGASNVMQIEVTVRELAGSLGMTEKELYRLVASEPIEGEEKWRQLCLPAEGGYKQYEIGQVEALRLFLPRLRYLYRVVEVGKPPQRVGFVLELLMDDIPTPEDAEGLRALISDFDIQGLGGASLNADFGIQEPLNVELDTQDLNADFGIQGPENASLNADFGTDGPLNANFVTHACMHANNNKNNTPPVRQSCGLGVPVLKNQHPTQPRDLSPDEAFNLALDKALAHLPARLRKCADAPLYTLAAEVHPAAIEDPSSRWPDAGGAGWVVDAVSDADSSGVEIGSVQYIRAIVSRWLAEGNPYAVPLGQPSESTGETTGRDIHAPLDDILPLYWKGATGQDLTDEGRELLIGLLGPKPDGVVESELLQIVAAIGREYRDVVAVTPELVGKAVRGGALPAIGSEPVPEPPARTGAPAVAMARSKPDAAELDPVLAQVTDWYLRDVGNIAPLLADDIRDLTQEQRDLTVWEFAFFETRAMPNPKSRWNFITAITHNPDWNKINAWLAAGKKEPARERKRIRRTSGGPRQKQRGLPPVPAVDEIPDPPVPDEVLPPLN